jgi:hypothetical protein
LLEFSELQKITLAKRTGKLFATTLAESILGSAATNALRLLLTRVARGDAGYLSAKDKYLFGSRDVTRGRYEFRKHSSNLLRVLSSPPFLSLFFFLFYSCPRTRPWRSARAGLRTFKVEEN